MMTYSEALFFLGRCLSLKSAPEHINEVREIIRSGSVEWEQVVWVSSSQFVFSALYLRLHKAGLLSELPSELVEYMKEFADLNRERNQKIIDQAIVITQLLNQKGITPVFLKGTAHLLDGLYEDITERQVGDIDLLVIESKMVSAAEILIAYGYTPSAAYNPKNFKITKHYPRLQNYNQVAAVEIHRQILGTPSYKTIECKTLIENKRNLDLPGIACVLCDHHQIIHNILHVQITHEDFYYASLNIRQYYDLYLLSLRVNPLDVVKNFGKYFHRMNGNLAVTAKVLNNPASISFEPSWQVNLILNRFMRNMNNPKWSRFSHAVLFLIRRFSNYVRVLIHLINDKDERDSLFSRLSNPKWYGAHLRSYKEHI